MAAVQLQGEQTELRSIATHICHVKCHPRCWTGEKLGFGVLPPGLIQGSASKLKVAFRALFFSEARPKMKLDFSLKGTDSHKATVGKRAKARNLVGAWKGGRSGCSDAG